MSGNRIDVRVERDGELVHHLNAEINVPNLVATVFAATLHVAILDPESRRLRYVNAGHNPQYVIGRSSRLERMSSTGLPVGLFAGRGYVEQEIQLSAGDVLFPGSETRLRSGTLRVLSGPCN